MTLPTPTFLDSLSLVTSDDVLVVGLRKTETGCQVHAPGLDDETIEALTTLAKAVDAEGGIDSHWRQAAPAGLDVKSVVFTGLGDGDVTADHLREAAGFAALQISGASRVVFALADSGVLLQAVVEGALLGSHRVSKPGKSAEDRASEVAFLGTLAQELTSRAVTSVEAVWRVRDLVTMPPNLLNPISFVDQDRKSVV